VIGGMGELIVFLVSFFIFALPFLAVVAIAYLIRRFLPKIYYAFQQAINSDDIQPWIDD